MRIEDWAGRPVPDGLVDLVQSMATGPPYNYEPTEVPHAREWFPPLAANPKAHLAVALDGSGALAAPVGYCLALPLLDHPSAAAPASTLVDQPATATYLAELGVAPSFRRRGIAAQLVTAVTDRAAGDVVVRTLVDNAPAIALYEQLGYRVAPHARQTHRGRDRLFLVRPRAER